jgi:hypothetical protein
MPGKIRAFQAISNDAHCRFSYFQWRQPFNPQRTPRKQVKRDEDAQDNAYLANGYLFSSHFH